MATPGERKALLFLSLVVVLGSGARLLSANAIPAPPAADVAALQGQIRVVDSVRRGARASGGGRRGRKASVARAKRSPDSSGAATLPPPFPPPVVPFLAPAVSSPIAARGPGSSPVDINVASAEQLEALPGIGPALARRIVSSRDSSGPFGSLDELQERVRGVGPALARRLAAAVTFSGRHSPPSAERTEPFGSGGTTARPKRRRGR